MLAAGVAAASPMALAETVQRAKRLAAQRGLFLGCAVEPKTLQSDAAFAALVQGQCSQITPENAMKWSVLQPDENHLDFAPADQLVRWAGERGLKVYGHCLVWHEALPQWVADRLQGGSAQALMDAHIEAVVGRYRGQARAWDVVIEAIERADGRADGLRRSPWLNALGPGYIEHAFRAAHSADPDARLALADYGLEYDDVPWMVEKRRAILTLIEGLKARGAPIHALNIQSHLIGDRPPAFGKPLQNFLGQVAALGLDIYVGELDVEDQKMAGDAAQRDARIGDIYRRYLDVVLAEPAVRSLSTWGLSDRYTAKAAGLGLS